MLEDILTTIAGIAVGYVLYKILFESLRQALHTRIEAFLAEHKKRKEERRLCKHRLIG